MKNRTYRLETKEPYSILNRLVTKKMGLNSNYNDDKMAQNLHTKLTK